MYIVCIPCLEEVFFCKNVWKLNRFSFYFYLFNKMCTYLHKHFAYKLCTDACIRREKSFAICVMFVLDCSFQRPLCKSNLTFQLRRSLSWTTFLYKKIINKYKKLSVPISAYCSEFMLSWKIYYENLFGGFLGGSHS